MAELIGDRIRKARRRCGISGAALAEQVGSTRQYISRIETNKSRDPGILLVEKIIDKLNVSADYILSGRQKPRRSLAELDSSEIKPVELAPV
jgi:transcriptional regulator with XRE-family HTH domain